MRPSTASVHVAGLNCYLCVRTVPVDRLTWAAGPGACVARHPPADVKRIVVGGSRFSAEVDDMPTPNDASIDAIGQRRDAFIERMLQSTRGTFEVFSIYIGVRLGFYEALAAGGPQTSVELASRTATAERYAREWLEQQSVARVIEGDDENPDARKRRFSLPAPYVEGVFDHDSLNYLPPLAR